MAAEIERIVDRKLIRSRVHYLVVWRGFGEENNTWESRMDLMADGFSAVIREYEDARKKEESGGANSTTTSTKSRSPSRGRSPGRRKSKSPSRGRSRSASGARSSSSTRSGKRTASKKETKKQTVVVSEKDVTEKTSPKKTISNDSSSTSTTTTTTTTTFVSRLETEGVDKKPSEESSSDELLRSTLAALDTPPLAMATTATTKSATETSSTPASTFSFSTSIKTTTTASSDNAPNGDKKTVTLAYEEEEEVLLMSPVKTDVTTATDSLPPSEATQTALLLVSSTVQRGAFSDMFSKMTERGWLLSFLSVAVVVGSLLASQVLPSASAEEEIDLWRQWLPFFVPLIALLLFFNQNDDRPSGKWIAIALAWRCAAELLVLLGNTPEEYQLVAAGAAGIANVALLITLVVLIRNNEHEPSKATLVVLAVGIAALFLSDSWVATTLNPAKETRVFLMSAAVMVISLSPVLTASADDDD